MIKQWKTNKWWNNGKPTNDKTMKNKQMMEQMKTNKGWNNGKQTNDGTIENKQLMEQWKTNKWWNNGKQTIGTMGNQKQQTLNHKAKHLAWTNNK